MPNDDRYVHPRTKEIKNFNYTPSNFSAITPNGQ